MIRENRYLVLKWGDIQNALDDLPVFYLNNFTDVLERIQLHLISVGKGNRKYVVVQDNWPEYETVWEMIEKRVDESK